MPDLEVRIDQQRGRVETGDLPTIDADPMQMRQLFKNLLENALKFHRQEKPPVVKVQGHLLNGQGNDPPRYLFMITDNGIGFDKRYLERVFVIFQRLHGLDGYRGVGVGLAICRKIAERHGGKIAAKSIPGQRATFVVTLPVSRPKGDIFNE